MDEKILIQSSHYNIKKFSTIISIVAIIISILIIIFGAIENYSYCKKEYYDDHWTSSTFFRPSCIHTKTYSDTLSNGYAYEVPALAETPEEFKQYHPTLKSYMKCYSESYSNIMCGGLITDDNLWNALIPLPLIIIAMLLYLWLSKYSLTVTDKRVYGKAAFGKRVDLPLDMVSAVGTSALKGISVGTSSGRIKFKLIKNRDEIHSTLSKLLMDRQQAEKKRTVSQPVVSASNADELEKFKKLLDSGVITQEEFDEKKKQLLGL